MTYGKIEGQDILFWGGTDGFLYAYPNETRQDEEGFDLFVPLWKVDCNEPNYRVDKEGEKSPTPPLQVPAN